MYECDEGARPLSLWPSLMDNAQGALDSELSAHDALAPLMPPHIPALASPLPPFPACSPSPTTSE